MRLNFSNEVQKNFKVELIPGAKRIGISILTPKLNNEKR